MATDKCKQIEETKKNGNINNHHLKNLLLILPFEYHHSSSHHSITRSQHIQKTTVSVSSLVCKMLPPEHLSTTSYQVTPKPSSVSSRLYFELPRYFKIITCNFGSELFQPSIGIFKRSIFKFFGYLK